MVRVLVVDDEINTLLSLRDRVVLSKEPVEFICFGIDEILYLLIKMSLRKKWLMLL